MAWALPLPPLSPCSLASFHKQIARDWGLAGEGGGASGGGGGKGRGKKGDAGGAAGGAAAAFQPLTRDAAAAAARKRQEAFKLPHKLSCGVTVTSLGTLHAHDPSERLLPGRAWAGATAGRRSRSCGVCFRRAGALLVGRLLRVDRRAQAAACCGHLYRPSARLPCAPAHCRPAADFCTADQLWPAGYCAEWEDEKGVRFISAITETPSGPMFRSAKGQPSLFPRMQLHLWYACWAGSGAQVALPVAHKPPSMPPR